MHQVQVYEWLQCAISGQNFVLVNIRVALSEALRPFHCELPTPTNMAHQGRHLSGGAGQQHQGHRGPGTEDNHDSANGGTGDTVGRHNSTEARAEEPGGEAWQGNGQAAATVTGSIA